MRGERIIEIACELYNREHRGRVTPENLTLLPGFSAQIYLRRAKEILAEKEKHDAAASTASLATAEEDRRFIEEHPVNGDIDLSPHPLL